MLVLTLLVPISSENSDKVDLATYNAQLLDTLSAEQVNKQELVDDGLAVSVITSTSSAITYDEREEVTVPPPRPRSDRTSQTSWGGFDGLNNVEVNDPELQAVFPQFAEAYNQEEGQLQADLADLDFVDQSDFAVLNQDGSIESFGRAEDLDDVIYADETYEVYDEYQQAPEEHQQAPEYDDYPDSGFDLGQGGGPTTLMLFNIFSPEEVDFLTTLVGEDAVKELKDDVDVPELEEDDLRQTLEATTQKSRRPPQFNEFPKNGLPSSQGNVRPGSNIRESLQVYHKSELQHQEQAGVLGEEGSYQQSHEYQKAQESSYQQPHIPSYEENVDRAASVVTYAPQPPVKQSGLIAKADERREKMEALLQKLSERYEKRQQGELQEDELDEAIRETDEKNDKMKVMIENLKDKLAKSRPGVNTIDMKNLDEPLDHQPKSDNLQQYYHTTAPPVHIDQISEMIGEKLRDMQVGIHTLDLDDMLDLDHIQVKNKGEDISSPTAALPQPPPGSHETKPKRQILHPKLTRKRPQLGKAHIPSVNLKSYITPATEAPNLAAVEYNQRPIIPRYVDEAIPSLPTPQPYSYQNEDADSKIKIKYLPTRQGPRLKGYKKPDDPYPETKELTPFHQYSRTTEYPVFNSHEDYQNEDKTEKSDSLPPPIFYSDTHVPDVFDPKVGPFPAPPGDDVAPFIDASSVEDDHDYQSKYIPSNTYRNQLKGDDGQSGRTSKEYSSAYTKYPPPSYNYKQPNIRFDETPTKVPTIQVTPKNVPVTTPHSNGVSTSYPKPDYVQSVTTQVSKQLPTRSYAQPPYRPPYESHIPPYRTTQPPKEEIPGSVKAEHISSLSPPARGYVPPLGHRTTDPPPHKPYHTPRPSYMTKIYPPRTGYVPPSSGNYISKMSPPSHGYSTPKPHVSSITPPHKNHFSLKPTYSGTSLAPPETGYSTPKPHVSSISPPKYGYSTPKPYHTMEPPKDSYANPKPYHAMEPPKESYAKPINSYVSTMSPPKKPYASHLSTMAPPEDKYKAPSHVVSYKPPALGYEKPMYDSMSGMRPPSQSYDAGVKSHLEKLPPPKHEYLPPKESVGYKPPDSDYLPPKEMTGYNPPNNDYLPPKKTEYKPPTAGDFTGLQPNYREAIKAIKPPNSAYEEGMKNIMSKLSLPEQEFLEHAMSGKSYLPPKEEYKSPTSGPSGYLPPKDEYKAPSKLTEDTPPSRDYIETMFKYLGDMAVPNKDYLPPSEAHFEPPKGSYDAPIGDYLSSMHLPRKGYLPPDDDKSSYQPPSVGYNDAMTDYMGKLQPPKSGYLPPKQKGDRMKPPASSYEEPVSDYMASMHPPNKGYLPPKGITGLLPELASYLSPISEYMASMIPPKTEYKYEEKMKPPSKGYQAPAKQYGANMKPPTEGYQAPAKQYGADMKPPTREYLTPFRPDAPKDPRLLALFPPKGEYDAPLPPQPSPRPSFVRTVCPPADKDVKCEYVKHQCWSPGVRDQDCPGEGLCCFNGCVNICLPPLANLPFSSFFHIPPNKAYLVPGQENLFLQTLASKRRNEEGTDALSEYFLPPNYASSAALDTVDISGLPERPPVRQLPRDQEKAKMQPPIKEYLPPPLPQFQLSEGYELPNYEGVDLSDIFRPATKYSPPNVKYQVSHEQVELQDGLLDLPNKEYLPPPKIRQYSPPADDYKAPKSLGIFVPPSNDYLPPDGMLKYKPPSEGYVAPGKITKYNPPDQDYLAPKERLKPPTDEYLPPPTLEPVLYSQGASFKPPSDEYIEPPNFAYSDSKIPILPPNQEFYLESANYEPTNGVLFHPPSKEYIPPALSVHDPYHDGKKGGAVLAPPDKKYLPPGSKVEDTLLEGVHYQLPTEEYLAPHPKAKPHAHQAAMRPPSEEFLNPHNGAYDPSNPHATLALPNKDYITPTGHPDHAGHAKLIPPVKEYLVPHHDSSTHGPVPAHAVFHPPSKEYLPPKPIVPPSGAGFKPPATDYVVPPTPGAILDPVHNIDMTYKPPSKEYLPPSDYNPKDNLPPPPHPSEIPYDDLPTLVPPHKEYLPPPSNTIEEIGHGIHIAEHHEHHHVNVPITGHHEHHHVNVPPALLPKPGTRVTVAPALLPKPDHHIPNYGQDYHITATINQDGHSKPHHGVVSKVGPHSINIQINIPDKEKPHYKDDHPTLFRTSKPPSTSGYNGTHQIGYEKHMPHMLPKGHEHHHEDGRIMPHMLPHGHHDGYEGGGPPPTLPQYVPPPISTTYGEGYHKMPKYLESEYHLPPRQYHPSYHRLPPKEYVPTNPLIYEEGYRKPSYDSKEPSLDNEDLLNPIQTFKPPLEEFTPPSELRAPIKANDYIPPEKATLRPPDKDYIPPATKEDYLPPEPVRDDNTIPRPPNPEEIPEDIDDGLPSRGPQFPLQQKEKEYVRPPPRPGSLDVVIEDILNSQVSPNGQGKEKYIPRKTKFDVPKNFIRPDDLLRAPPFEAGFDGLDGFDPDDDVDEFGTIDILDAEDLPEPPIPEAVPEQLTEQPFLGLAKLIDPERKKSLKELEDLRAEVKKLAKLVEKEKPEGPQLPPIPTVPSLLSFQKLQKLPPQPSSFMPFLEKLDNSVLQQLQKNVRSQNTRDGKIPGKPGVDYPDFKTIPATDFSCENFLLEGFYADTFTSCQVSSRHMFPFKTVSFYFLQNVML